jgi:hypothetical protein
MEGMGDFVTDQHIVQTVRHILPDWQGKNPILEIEGSSLCGWIMHYREILGCEEAREDGFRVAHAYIIPYPAPKATHTEDISQIVDKLWINREIWSKIDYFSHFCRNPVDKRLILCYSRACGRVPSIVGPAPTSDILVDNLFRPISPYLAGIYDKISPIWALYWINGLPWTMNMV